MFIYDLFTGQMLESDRGICFKALRNNAAKDEKPLSDGNRVVFIFAP